MISSRLLVLMYLAIIAGLIGPHVLRAEDVSKASPRPKRLLLLGSKPDSHPRATHEYMQACRIIAKLLQDRGTIQVVVEQADNPWKVGPEMLDGADAVFLFLSEGAKWVSADADRLAAFRRLEERGGGLSCLHWGMGTKDADNVPNFVSLFGGCHGGPDRKYRYGDFDLHPTPHTHPITRGVSPIQVHDEFYFDLKFPVERTRHTMLLEAHIEGHDYPVGWAWERLNAGRSFGFSGLHFHDNWNRIDYRRTVVQGVLWTLREEIPESGLALDVTEADLALPEAGKLR